MIYLGLCKEASGEISVAVHIVHSSFTTTELLSQLKSSKSVCLGFFVSHSYTMPYRKRFLLNIGWLSYLLKLNMVNNLKTQLKEVLKQLPCLAYSGELHSAGAEGKSLQKEHPFSSPLPLHYRSLSFFSCLQRDQLRWLYKDAK